MARLIALADERDRDAQIAVEPPRPRSPWRFVAPDGRLVESERFVKTTVAHDHDVLLAGCGDDPTELALRLVEADPEVDLTLTGRMLGDADRIYVRADGSALFAARVLEVVAEPGGEETSRADIVDVAASVGRDEPMRLSGRLFPVEHVVHRFALVRKLQLRHVDELTFDFLYELAERLERAQKVALVGAGPKGNEPLIMTANGTPYRGFLEGRVDGERYRLVLHLSNLQLAPPASSRRTT